MQRNSVVAVAMLVLGVGDVQADTLKEPTPADKTPPMADAPARTEVAPIQLAQASRRADRAVPHTERLPAASSDGVLLMAPELRRPNPLYRF